MAPPLVALLRANRQAQMLGELSQLSRAPPPLPLVLPTKAVPTMAGLAARFSMAPPESLAQLRVNRQLPIVGETFSLRMPAPFEFGKGKAPLSNLGSR